MLFPDEGKAVKAVFDLSPSAIASELLRRFASPSDIVSEAVASFRAPGATLSEGGSEGIAVAFCPVIGIEGVPICDVVGVAAINELDPASGAAVSVEFIFGSGRFCMTENKS